MFCRHDWALLSEKVTETQAAHAVSLGFTEVKGGNMFERKLIQILTCKKCGKLKRFVEFI